MINHANISLKSNCLSQVPGVHLHGLTRYFYAGIQRRPTGNRNSTLLTPSLHSFLQIISCCHVLGVEVTIFIPDFSSSLPPASSLSLSLLVLVYLMKFYSSLKFHLMVLHSLWSPSPGNIGHVTSHRPLTSPIKTHIIWNLTTVFVFYSSFSLLGFYYSEGRDNFLFIRIF